MPHRFKTGQAVVLIRTNFGPREVYEVVRHMPRMKLAGRNIASAPRAERSASQQSANFDRPDAAFPESAAA
jgi:hypothetical protein